MAKEIILPEGFEVDRIENGKVILKEVKSKYPETWEECLVQMKFCEYIDGDSDIYRRAYLFTLEQDKYNLYHNTLPEGYGKKILALCQLLICREIYWNGWKPDWKDSTSKFMIKIHKSMQCREDGRYYQCVLAFPTREMRDAFHENFKDLIEEAKDLL